MIKRKVANLCKFNFERLRLLVRNFFFSLNYCNRFGSPQYCGMYKLQTPTLTVLHS
jgi:hypothetical protein